MVESFQQRMAGCRVELKGRVAALQVKIKQNYPALALLCEVPRRLRGDCGGSNAAADAEYNHDLAGPPGALIEGSGNDAAQHACHHAAYQRLEEVFGDARRFHVPVEHDIVAVADCDDFGRWVADLGKTVDPRHRIGEARHVDDEEARRALPYQFIGRGIDVAAYDVTIDEAKI